MSSGGADKLTRRSRGVRTAVASVTILVVGIVLVPLMVESFASMDTAAKLFLLPLSACLVIAATHCYLGLHVVEREIIFVDLAFAQLASLGAVFAVIPWLAARSGSTLLLSLAFVFLGSVIFTLSRSSRQLVPQEAVIGIVYAVSTAAAIIVGDKLPGGLERIKEVLVGKILWVDAAGIGLTSRLYAVLMVLHLVCFRRFAALSGLGKEHQGRPLGRWWDLLFYLSFGVVIMRSVDTAGILLVFALLVVPAVISMVFLSGLWPRLLVAWAVSALGAATGIALSFWLDLPAGPTIVCLLGLGLAVAGSARSVFASSHPILASARIVGLVGCGLAALGAVYLVSPTFTGQAVAHGEPAGGHQHDHLHHHEEEEVNDEDSLEAHLMDHYLEAGSEERAALRPQLRSHMAGLLRLLASEDPEVREKAARVLAGVADTSVALQPLRDAYQSEEDGWVKLAMASSLLAVSPAEGRRALAAIAESEAPEMVRAEARRLLAE